MNRRQFLRAGLAPCALALEFQERYPETTLVLTTDHGNANPGLNGHGGGYADSGRDVERILSQRGTYTRIASAWTGSTSKEAVHASVREECGIELSERELDVHFGAVQSGRGPDPYRYRSGLLHTWSSVLANHAAVGWCGCTHTADFVPLLIKGRELPRLPALIRNTDLHYLMKERIGLLV